MTSSNNNNNNDTEQQPSSLDRLIALIYEHPTNKIKHAHVLRVLTSLNPFSEDGGLSAGAMSTFDIVQWQMVHLMLESWVAARPGAGGQQYGYEAVVLPGDSRVSIIAPNGTVYTTLI